MQRFLLTFFFFLSCGLNSGYTETLAYEHSLLNEMCAILSSPENQKELKCTHDKECETFILGSKCIEESCKCDEDSVLSSDASKCLTRAKEFGSPCEDSIQCSSLLSSGGICENNKCLCKSGYHYLRGSCWRNVDLNKYCATDEQCYASHQYVGLECKNEMCQCRENYYTRLGSGCRRRRKNGESCNLDDDCEGSTCNTSKRCGSQESVTLNINSSTTLGQIRKSFNCRNGMFKLNGECVRELGMKCTSDAECSHIKQAVCLDNSICACQPVLLVPSEDNRKCLKVAQGKVDNIQRSSCQSNSQCEVFGPNSYCKEKRCACKDGTYFEVENSFCWAIKSLNESCNIDKDCHSLVTHAECMNTPLGKKCLCQTGYHEKGSKCFPDGSKVGDICEDDNDCFIPNTFCNATKVCDCEKHYYPEEGKCKPGVERTCTADKDCANLKNTECKTGESPLKQCLCKENHTISDNYKYCLPVANYKETCEESFQCEFHLGSLRECKNKSCECREGAHYSSGKCHESKFIGESCSKQQDCFPGNDSNSVICLKGICKCNYDYKLAEDKICVKINSAKSLKSFSVLLTSLLLFWAIVAK